jgi:hypothetical protein
VMKQKTEKQSFDLEPDIQRLKSKSAYEKLYCIVLYSIALYFMKISKSCKSNTSYNSNVTETILQLFKLFPNDQFE